MTRILTFAIIILATLILVAFLTGGSFESRTGESISITRISLLCGYLILVSGGMYAAFKSNAGQMLKYAAVWIAIGGLIALLYQVTH